MADAGRDGEEMATTSKRGVNLRQMAETLGLSQGTVSRALNDYPDIAETTRQRVVAAARRLGYRPSSVARRLARGRVETVGFVLPAGRGDAHLSNPFMIEILDGVDSILAEHDMDLLVSTARDPGHEIEVYNRLIRSGKVDGLIVVRTRTRDERIEFLRETRFPFVAHGRTEDPRGYAWLDTDNVAAFADATGHLADLGHCRIALIGGPEDLNFARLRRQGFRRGLDDRRLAARDEYERPGDMTENGGHAAATALLDLAEPPTAILCVNDITAFGAMRAVRERNLEVGRDVSIIGYDGLPMAAYLDPPLTTITQRSREAGRRLAEILLALIDGGDPVEHQELWPAQLIRRGSDGRVAGATKKRAG